MIKGKKVDAKNNTYPKLYKNVQNHIHLVNIPLLTLLTKKNVKQLTVM